MARVSGLVIELSLNRPFLVKHTHFDRTAGHLREFRTPLCTHYYSEDCGGARLLSAADECNWHTRETLLGCTAAELSSPA